MSEDRGLAVPPGSNSEGFLCELLWNLLTRKFSKEFLEFYIGLDDNEAAAVREAFTIERLYGSSGHTSPQTETDQTEPLLLAYRILAR